MAIPFRTELTPTSHGSRDMHLFFDVETTGMIDWKAPMLSPRQPRVVQLAAILDDADGKMVRTIDAIVDPMTSNWSEPVLDALINSDVSRIHGISYDRARSEGLSLPVIMDEFVKILTDITAGDGPPPTLVAHNMAFDSRMMMAELCYADFPPSLLNALRPFCTMEAMTPIMAMPGKYGKHKWPKLLEAHLHCFGTGIQNAHNALADTMACRAIYYHGREMGWWK
jgi:DNA polymerase III epsilon subunit-like protein